MISHLFGILMDSLMKSLTLVNLCIENQTKATQYGKVTQVLVLLNVVISEDVRPWGSYHHIKLFPPTLKKFV